MHRICLDSIGFSESAFSFNAILNRTKKQFKNDFFPNMGYNQNKNITFAVQ